MACGIVVSEFELQSRYYVHFWLNTLRKDINFFIPHQLWVKVINSTFSSPNTSYLWLTFEYRMKSHSLYSCQNGGVLIYLASFCLDVAQGQINGIPSVRMVGYLQFKQSQRTVSFVDRLAKYPKCVVIFIDQGNGCFPNRSSIVISSGDECCDRISRSLLRKNNDASD